MDNVGKPEPLPTVRPIRVLQLVLTLGVGGTERLVIELVRRLSDRVSSAVCCIDEQGEWAGELAAVGVPVTELRRAPGFQPALASRIAKLAAAFGADVVHCHHYSPFVYGQMAAVLNRRLRVVFTEHGRLSDASPSLKRRMVNGLLGRLGAQIFAVSHSLREHMIGEGLPAGRIGVIHNGIDAGPSPAPTARADARQRLGLSPSAEVLGTVARLDPVKDFDTMLESIALLRQARPGVKLVVLGDGPERKRLESVIRAKGLEETVVLAGHRSDARMLLPAFDVYVNTSLSEGISIAILEGMAAALPVVATNVGGNPEVVDDGRSGLLVAARSSRQIADASARFLESLEARRSFGDTGRNRVVTNFAFNRMADAYWQAYDRARSS
jgi:L-malate glycosyltransferase